MSETRQSIHVQNGKFDLLESTDRASLLPSFDFTIIIFMFVCFASSNLQSHIPQHIVFTQFNSSLRQSNLFNFKDVFISLILIGLFPKLLLAVRFQLTFHFHTANALAQTFFFLTCYVGCHLSSALFCLRNDTAPKMFQGTRHTGQFWQLLFFEIVKKHNIC